MGGRLFPAAGGRPFAVASPAAAAEPTERPGDGVEPWAGTVRSGTVCSDCSDCAAVSVNSSEERECTTLGSATDKAANPCSVLGRSKRIGERLVAEAADVTGLPYLSVRFGNVLASRGSVLTTFAEQLAAGGPITVTHPEVTRYFMTIPEAVQLVIQAAAVGRPGETLVLDMGEPVRILDVAHQLMEIAGQGVDIVYTGLRGGEKLHEELFGDGEVGRRPAHPLISHVDVPALSFARARRHAALVGADAAMVDLLSGGRSWASSGALLLPASGTAP